MTSIVENWFVQSFFPVSIQSLGAVRAYESGVHLPYLERGLNVSLGGVIEQEDPSGPVDGLRGVDAGRDATPPSLSEGLYDRMIHL